MSLEPAVSLKRDESRLSLRSGHLIPSLSAVMCGEEQCCSQHTSVQPETGREGPATCLFERPGSGLSEPLQTSAVAVDGDVPRPAGKGLVMRPPGQHAGLSGLPLAALAFTFGIRDVLVP